MAELVVFKRLIRPHLFIIQNVSLLLQALSGVTLNVPCLDGRKIPLHISDVIKPNSVRRIQGEGLPYSKQPSMRGDLIIEFDVQFPDSISNHARQKIAELLPTTKPC